VQIDALIFRGSPQTYNEDVIEKPALAVHGDTDFRRRDLARELMDFTLDFAWARSCTEVMLLSGRDLAPAHALYEDIGFDKQQRTGFIKFRPTD